ncbi:aldehyde dehydrogenase family protein [Microbispora sp. ATCC PTA-5024]|uniref:aldehyde dehydrogenase family protein n=1 Tax=Microbispora sp. ATCC PTA-5024 TaxID=316330 RepID=UPI0003DD6A36|nr:aldehyde dehydrogenase family protein [Microbispora sp. ATCC PTA-5024]ETK31724.1 benzaldehyde dehydrogenase [Microbispora sp. ATCC PTA-5024]
MSERPTTLFIGGAFEPPSGGKTIDVLDKATGETLATVDLAGVPDVDRAVASAAAAQPAWAAATYAERAAVLRRAAAILGDRSGELRELLVRETGCIPGKADYEIGAAAGELTEAAALASRPVGEILPTTHPGRLSVSERVPLGVVGLITPWNFPLVLGMRVVAPALALGNTVVLKPSPETPLSGGLTFAEVFAEAGAPPGVLQVLPGGADVGERIVEHPDVAMVHFTGSTAVGRRIAATAGGLLKKASLELGGNNALIVLEDADLDRAAMIGAWSSFHYQGQTCITAGRHIVVRAVADRYVAALAARADAITVGNPHTEPVGLGPMINERQRRRAEEMLEEAVAAGARVVTGGSARPPYLRPAVVTGVTPGMRLWDEEIFAPIAPVLVVDDEEAAVRAANDTGYGLVNAVVTADTHRGLRLARRLRGGMAHVNDATPQDEALAPFGGVGQSGLGGRSGGEANLEEFTQRRWITSTDAPLHYPY